MPATVVKLVRLGFEVRVDAIAAGQEVWIQITRGEADRLDLRQAARSTCGRSPTVQRLPSPPTETLPSVKSDQFGRLLCRNCCIFVHRAIDLTNMVGNWPGAVADPFKGVPMHVVEAENIETTDVDGWRRAAQTALHPSGHPIGDDVLVAIAAGLAAVTVPWELGHGEVPAERRYERLLMTPAYDAWVICWPGGGSLDLHDHGGSAGAFSVVSGELHEERASSATPQWCARSHPARLPDSTPQEFTRSSTEGVPWPRAFTCTHRP